MRRVLRTLGISIFNAIIIVIMLVIMVQLRLPMAGLYFVFAATATIYPAAMILLYRRLWEAETLVIIPISLILSALYSLGVSMYSYYGTGEFSVMFKDLMYFIYFLPSTIYCIIAWIIFGIMAKVAKSTRRREF